MHPNLILEQAGGMEITGNEEDPSLISDRTEMAISMLLDVRSDLCQHRVRGFHVYTYNCVCVCVCICIEVQYRIHDVCQVLWKQRRILVGETRCGRRKVLEHANVPQTHSRDAVEDKCKRLWDNR